MKFSGWLIVLIAIFLFGFSTASRTGTNVNQNGTQITERKSEASLMIDFGNGTLKTYKDIAVTSTTTAFHALKEAIDSDNTKLEYKDYGGDLGVFVESIAGVGKDPQSRKWWQYWVNNNYSQMGVSSYEINPGDVIEFKYIEGQH